MGISSDRLPSMADTELRLSLDEEPSRPFMAEDEEMAESSSGEPHKDLHHLSLTFPSFEISAVLDQTSNATALPRDFDMNKEPVAGDPPEEATTATRRSSGCSGVSGELVAESEVSSQRASEMEKWSARKKLRLSIEQSALLEECFKHHNILDPKQKLSLAEQLNLSPRQVEVWFQNRRARTKQKQTEEEYGQLKLYCKALKEENRRLAKELTELHASSMHVPPTALTLHHSCGRHAGDAATSATTTATAHSTLSVAAAAGGNRQPRSIAALFSDPVGVYSFTKQSQNLPRQPPRI